MVYFIGAGPGDPDLITVKGKRIIEEADVIIYAGSLVNPQVFAGHKPEAMIYDSSSMILEEILDVIEEAVKEGKTVARIHTGDPSIYGAIREQIDALQHERIDCQIIPGVSSFTAAAAAVKAEYTLPGVSQTVILTRHAGRTPVPTGQELEALAVHKASLVIFLSIQMIEEVVKFLLPSYGAGTPVTVIQRVTWSDEKVIRGTLGDIEGKVKKSGIRKTALILVGDFMGNEYELSRLYDKTFSHEYRRGEP